MIATTSPTISVIIPCFNAARFIEAALASVADQDYPQLDVIVVDDHSSDGSADLVRARFPWARVVPATKRGASAARNLGTELAVGEYIQYLDADDLLVSGKLRRQWQALLESGADIAYGDWQRLIPVDGGYEPGEVVVRTLDDPEIDLFTHQWSPPAVYLFRRSIVERVGIWREDLPIIQDARFALDCALHGARFVRCSGIVALYRVHAAGSLSTQDDIGFARDCFRNAGQVEDWWSSRGGLDERRLHALLDVYQYVARSAFERDRALFDAAYQALQRLRPGYHPSHPRHLRVAAAVLGYRQAEHMALWYRRSKGYLRSLFV